MVDSKQFKLEIQFTEITAPRPLDSGTLHLNVSVGSNTHQLTYKTLSYITIAAFSPDALIMLQLSDSAILATGSIALGRLCDKTITGNFEKWVKLEPEKGQGLEGAKGVKVKIQGSLGNKRGASPAKRPKALQVSPSKSRGKCGYVKKLNSVEETEKDIHDTVIRVRNRLGPEYEELIEDGIRSPTRSPGRSAGKSPLRKSRFGDEAFSDYEPYLALPSRFDLNIEQLSSSEPHLLRNIAIGLCQKIRVMKAQVEEYEAIQEVVVTFDSPMEELAQSMSETREQLRSEDGIIETLIAQVTNDNSKISEAVTSVDAQVMLLEEEIAKVRLDIEKVRLENEKVVFDGENVEAETKKIQKLKKEIMQDDEERENLISSYQTIVSSFSSSKLNNELIKLEEERSANSLQLNHQTSLLDHANIEALQLESSIALAQSEYLCQEDQKSRSSGLNYQNQSYSHLSNDLEKAYQELNALKEINISESLNHSRKIEIDIKDYQNSYPALEADLSNKEKQIQEYAENLEEFKKHLEEIEGLLKNDEGIYDQYNDFKLQFDAEVKTQEDLLKEISYFSDLVFLQAQAGLLTNRLYRRLEDMLEEKEYQKGSMQKMIEDIKKSKPAYVGKRDDTTDLALARYLNARENALEVNFIRVDKEKYTFGTKKVEIKKEDGNLYVYYDTKRFTIDDFIEGYNAIEKEKQDEQAEIKRQNSLTKQSPIFGPSINMTKKDAGRMLTVLGNMGSQSPQRGLTVVGARDSPQKKRSLA